MGDGSGGAMAASIAPGSNPAVNCVADGGLGFSRKSAGARSVVKVPGGADVGGSSCRAWNFKGSNFSGGQVVPLLKQGTKSPLSSSIASLIYLSCELATMNRN